MRIAFSSIPKNVSTPWGGGNVLLSRVQEALLDRGHEVVFSFDESCDLIYLTDPRVSTHLYDISHHTKVPIIQRVGDVGTHNKPQLTEMLKEVLPRVTAAIFPSVWAETQLKDYLPKTSYIVPNVPDSNFFKRKLKVVTHHWSDNPMKGKDIYELLQRDQEKLNIEFTFIGRPCFQIEKPTKHIPPMSKTELAEELPKHDFYVTASRLEAGANHVLEAMACGLPVVYHKEGGSIPEYVNGRGISYSNYSELEAILSPLGSLDSVCDRYCAIFERVYNESPNRNR